MKNSTNDIPLDIKEISILEDSRYFVNRAVNALNLQMRRLENPDYVDDLWADITDTHFYIVALKRLRQSVLVGTKVEKIKSEIQNAIEIFDTATSDAIQMRHILEHVDEYVQNKGRNKSIQNSTLYTILPCEGGISWAGLEFNRFKTQEAAENLVQVYREVTSKEFKLYKEYNEEKVSSL